MSVEVSSELQGFATCETKLPEFSLKEIAVVKHWTNNTGNILNDLNLSLDEYNRHRVSIFNKSGVGSPLGAIIFFAENQIIDTGEIISKQNLDIDAFSKVSEHKKAFVDTIINEKRNLCLAEKDEASKIADLTGVDDFSKIVLLRIEEKFRLKNITVERDGIRVVLSTDQKIKSLFLNGHSESEAIKVINEAIQLSKDAAEKEAQIGGKHESLEKPAPAPSVKELTFQDVSPLLKKGTVWIKGEDNNQTPRTESVKKDSGGKSKLTRKDMALLLLTSEHPGKPKEVALRLGISTEELEILKEELTTRFNVKSRSNKPSKKDSALIIFYHNTNHGSSENLNQERGGGDARESNSSKSTKKGERVSNKPSGNLSSLEIRVVEAIAAGPNRRNAALAKSLGVADGTIKTVKSIVAAKLDVKLSRSNGAVFFNNQAIKRAYDKMQNQNKV